MSDPASQSRCPPNLGGQFFTGRWTATNEHDIHMKEVGIREVRQNLSALIAEVRKGYEITITERGKPVARLVPPLSIVAKPFQGRSAFRRSMPKLNSRLSKAVIDGREEGH